MVDDMSSSSTRVVGGVAQRKPKGGNANWMHHHHRRLFGPSHFAQPLPSWPGRSRVAKPSSSYSLRSMVHYEWFTRRRYVHFCGIHFNHYYNPDFLKYSWDWMAIALLPEWKRQNAKGRMEICCGIPERTSLGMPDKPIESLARRQAIVSDLVLHL